MKLRIRFLFLVMAVPTSLLFAHGKGKEKRIWSTPTVADGTVFFGAMDDYLYAASLDDGSELWKFKTGGTVITTPLVVGTKVIFGSFDRKLYALDASDNGKLLWSFKADNWFWAAPIQPCGSTCRVFP